VTNLPSSKRFWLNFSLKANVKKIFIAVLLILTLVFAGIIISYWVSQSGLNPLTPEVRQTLQGEFVELEDGFISYYWKGDEGGDIVVLVHGLSTPKFVWNQNVEALVEGGYRVLAFDHYGRGFSDRPDIRYDADLYDRELLNLLNALEVKKKISLIGYSMGGGVVTGFVARHPEKVKSVVLIAPAGFIPEYSGLAALVLAPVLGDWLMALFGKEAMVADIRAEVAAGKSPPTMLTDFEEQFRFKGYLPSILSTMRNYPMSDLSLDYATAGKQGIPTYAIWGTEDKSVPFAGTDQVKQYIPHVQIFAIKGASHSVPYAEADQVNKILLEVLAK